MKPVISRIRIFLIILISVLIAGTIGFVILEGISPSDALYFTVVTIATVGYGDITPVTTAGKILAAVLIITGVASFSGFIVNGTQVIMERHQERMRNERLNMLISLFFSEIGTELLSILALLDPDLEKIRSEFINNDSWTEQKFVELEACLRDHKCQIEPQCIVFESLRAYLLQNGGLLVLLLENPSLVERGAFTESLRATLHLRDELILRKKICGSPDSDLNHLANDAKRVYISLTLEWIDYMRYLNKKYPYLFSLALRTNPFSASRSPIIDE